MAEDTEATEAKIVVVGTGVLGAQVLLALHDRGHPAEQVSVLSSEANAGSEIDYGEEQLPIEKATPDAMRGATVVVLATPPDISLPLAEAAQQQGAWVVDASGAFRTRLEVPLVFPDVNDKVLDTPFKGRIVSLAAPLPSLLAGALHPLGASTISEVSATVLLGAALAGHRGVKVLEGQTAALLNGRDPEGQVFAHRLAFNAVPQWGPFTGPDTSEELAAKVELARLWGPQTKVNTTALWVPLFHGLVANLTVRLNAATGLEQVKQKFAVADGLKWLDEPAQGVYPMPLLSAGDPSLQAGRLRVDGARVELLVCVDPSARAAEQAVDLALELADREG